MNEEIKKLLPEELKMCVEVKDIEEIRLRVGKPASVRRSNKIHIISSYKCTKEDVNQLLLCATNHSMHTYLENFKNGFITIKGGHRIGICGQMVEKNGEVINFKQITSVNVRIAKNISGFNQKMLEDIKDKNVLVISKPNIGKTTLLREIIRYLSKENYNISVVDERSELADDQFELGDNVDVITGCNKFVGSMMMLKTMSPDYIVLDEITDNTEILQKIANCGTKIVASVHSDDYKTLKKRGRYKELLSFFDKFIEISVLDGKRRYLIKGSENCG